MKGDTMETFDIMAIIEKSLDRGHTVVIVDDVVTLYPNETEKPVRVEANPELKPKKQRKSINRKELDMGKVKALREAGWSFDKIADEMGCAPQTIANHLKEVET